MNLAYATVFLQEIEEYLTGYDDALVGSSVTGGYPVHQVRRERQLWVPQ